VADVAALPDRVALPLEVLEFAVVPCAVVAVTGCEEELLGGVEAPPEESEVKSPVKLCSG